ncbi:prepilin-type N-terminal cleavage/methylation domain-containing protein [Planctomyces sp. SH-PL62]|uniref:prepilin-type N-terminal cleavage/methylation domain-containing protein n=1 Tax=Planctomyces sp. SH-PL62 TaxID=1636152 RepID=UPI00078C1596|nr:prepilin-type N-terminal cleavage/methylation domain-containing protein [Planctomyces sp. SH-PL62]AMV38835.1 Fimbrial protein precursor [Planctomyces sp. SH-PL62]
MKRLTPPRSAGRPLRGFTLVELLVVLLIVGIIAAVALPVVIPAISHRQVSESARIVQGGLIAARDAALRTNTPHGIRFLPDSTYNGIDPNEPNPLLRGQINPFRTLASNRFIPIEQPPGYSEGKVFLNTTTRAFNLQFDNAPSLTGPGGLPSAAVYDSGRLLMIIQSRFRTVYDSSGNPLYPLESPTSWFWNVRKGDKIQVNNTGPFFTVVGPMDFDNPEKFVNVDPAAPALWFNHPVSGSKYYPEFLFVVNGEDDDKDGYIDNGYDGLDNNLINGIDDLGEWSEAEKWPAAFMTASPSVVGQAFNGVPYTIIRRPVPSPGARETVLPSNVVVDLTTSFLTAERSRLPVDPYSGNVDILLDPSGRVVPSTQYSSPASFGMASSFYHIWLAERSDLAEVQTTGTAPNVTAVPLISGRDFLLPMPLGQNFGASPNAYDALVDANPTLPYLKGEMRLLTLFTRTGNLMTTDRPVFDVTTVERPYHAPQLGEQGDTP